MPPISLGLIWQSATRRSSSQPAFRQIERFLATWSKRCAPVAAASPEDAGNELLTSFRFPASLHPSRRGDRTTNLIERVNVAFRRRDVSQFAVLVDQAGRLSKIEGCIGDLSGNPSSGLLRRPPSPLGEG